MTDLLEALSQPLRYPFMVRGLLASLMVGTLCAVVGTYVVLRGMAFFGEDPLQGFRCLEGLAMFLAAVAILRLEQSFAREDVEWISSRIRRALSQEHA